MQSILKKVFLVTLCLLSIVTPLVTISRIVRFQHSGTGQGGSIAGLEHNRQKFTRSRTRRESKTKSSPLVNAGGHQSTRQRLSTRATAAGVAAKLPALATWDERTAAVTLINLAHMASTDRSTALNARIAARGCHNRRQQIAPPTPGVFVLGAPKSGTTDMFFRTRSMPWAVPRANKESQWFDFACFQSVFEFSGPSPAVSAAGQLACPPTGKTPQELGRQPNFETHVAFTETSDGRQHTAAAGAVHRGVFPAMNGGYAYMHNCTAWHYQQFFVSGTYQCLRDHAATLTQPLVFPPSDSLWLPLSLPGSAGPTLNGSKRNDAGHAHFAAHVRGHPLWLRPSHTKDAHFEGWRIQMDWTARTLVMEDGAAMAAHVSPLTRFVYMHRHPVDRMWSQFQHLRSNVKGEATAPMSPALFHQRVVLEVAQWQQWKQDLLKATGTFLQQLHAALATAHRCVARSLALVAWSACVDDFEPLKVNAQSHWEAISASETSCLGAIHAHWSISSHMVESALLNTSSAWSHAWHMPPSVPNHWRKWAGEHSDERLQAALDLAKASKEWILASQHLLSSFAGLDWLWRQFLRSLEDKAAAEEHWYDDWHLIARSLYAIQHIRLMGVMPLSDILALQSEEYFRDPHAVLSLLQVWLCVPHSKAACQEKHPFQKFFFASNSTVKKRPAADAKPVHARPSHRAGNVLPQTAGLLEAELDAATTQHAELLSTMRGHVSARKSVLCLRLVQRKCRLQWRSMPTYARAPAAAKQVLESIVQRQEQLVQWNEASACVHAVLAGPVCEVPLGPLAMVAPLQRQRTDARPGLQLLGSLRHRFSLQQWNSSLLSPCVAAAKGTCTMPDYLHEAAATLSQHPGAGLKQADCHAKLAQQISWDRCLEAGQ